MVEVVALFTGIEVGEADIDDPVDAVETALAVIVKWLDSGVINNEPLEATRS